MCSDAARHGHSCCLCKTLRAWWDGRTPNSSMQWPGGWKNSLSLLIKWVWILIHLYKMVSPSLFFKQQKKKGHEFLGLGFLWHASVLHPDFCSFSLLNWKKACNILLTKVKVTSGIGAPLFSELILIPLCNFTLNIFLTYWTQSTLLAPFISVFWSYFLCSFIFSCPLCPVTLTEFPLGNFLSPAIYLVLFPLHACTASLPLYSACPAG